MIIYFFWLILVVLWNYGFPEAKPISDVVAAIIFGFCANKLKRII